MTILQIDQTIKTVFTPVFQTINIKISCFVTYSHTIKSFGPMLPTQLHACKSSIPTFHFFDVFSDTYIPLVVHFTSTYKTSGLNASSNLKLCFNYFIENLAIHYNNDNENVSKFVLGLLSS